MNMKKKVSKCPTKKTLIVDHVGLPHDLVLTVHLVGILTILTGILNAIWNLGAQGVILTGAGMFRIPIFIT